METRITYSFIIPHKNTPDLLQRCLDSIPVREDIEVIVVDNNSSPDMVDFDHFPIANRDGLRIVRDNHSSGGGGARNTGLALARGEWVLFADADDYYSEGFLDILDDYSDCKMDVLYFNQNVLKGGKVVRHVFEFIDNYREEEENTVLAIKYKHHVPWNKMARRDFLTKHGVCFEDCVAGNDILYSYLCGYYARQYRIERAKLYNYVVNPDSVVHKRKNNSIYYICVFSHLYQSNTFFEHIHHEELKRSLFSRFLSILLKKGLLQGLYALFVFGKYHQTITSCRNFFVDKIKG